MALRVSVGLISDVRYDTYSTSKAINAGLDLEMPGPTRWRGQLLTHALMSNKITQYTLDERVYEVLKLVSRVSRTGVPEHASEMSRDIPKTADHLRRIAGESIVLLKNERSVLPLNKSKTVSHVLNCTQFDGQDCFSVSHRLLLLAQIQRLQLTAGVGLLLCSHIMQSLHLMAFQPKLQTSNTR